MSSSNNNLIISIDDWNAGRIPEGGIAGNRNNANHNNNNNFGQLLVRGKYIFKWTLLIKWCKNNKFLHSDNVARIPEGGAAGNRNMPTTTILAACSSAVKEKQTKIFSYLTF